MISAEEAYKMTNDLVQKKFKRIQNKINRKIKRQIKCGKYSLSLCSECFTDCEIRKSLLEYYRNMNYNAKIEFTRYDIYSRQCELFISWRNPQNAEGTKERLEVIDDV
jgi:hypothetical protein